jgi:hypothetical protein
MRKIFAFTAMAMMVAGTPAMAAACKDPKTGKFAKCPEPAAKKVVRCKDGRGKFVKCGTAGAKPM